MIEKFLRVTVLLVVLAGFWMALSGFFKPLLLGLGVLSCVFVAWITLRKSLVEAQSVLTQIYWVRWWRYNFWLVGQIIKASIDVSRRILDPRMPISPTVDKVPANLPDMGKVIYANSITLTPGTVSINLTDDGIIVHSLTRENIEALHEGEMCRRVKELVRNEPQTS